MRSRAARTVLGIAGATVFLCVAQASFAATRLIDDFEGGSSNKLGGRVNTYVMAPSRALALNTEQEKHGGAKSLMIKYDKKGKGGPYDSGGWCGYYTLLKSGPRYFDGTPYQAITFWVKGAQGGESFEVGLSDRHWEQVGDSVKSEPIGKYLPEGKVTASWQKATVALDAFMLEKKELVSLAICFEGSLYPGGESRGTLYVDDLMFE